MKDRVKLNNGKSSKLACPTTYAPADFAAFLVDLKAGNVYVDITANNSTTQETAGVSQIGTALNKANLLSDATATKLGYDASQDPTIDNALDSIADRLDGFVTTETITLTTAGWTTSTTTAGDTLYSQIVPISSMTAAKQHSIGINLANPSASDNKAARDNAIAGYNDWIYDGWYECGAGNITFKTYNLPQYNFSLVVVGG